MIKYTRCILQRVYFISISAAMDGDFIQPVGWISSDAVRFHPTVGRISFLAPVPQSGDDSFHVRAYLLCRPSLVCHVLNAEVDELLRA